MVIPIFEYSCFYIHKGLVVYIAILFSVSDVVSRNLLHTKSTYIGYL